MNEIAFNLLDEPWILVRDRNCLVSEVSLTDALLQAHQYCGVEGELPTQDVAVLRLLLAVLHTVFSRMDLEGNPAEPTNAGDVLKIWGALWNLGRFPEQPIRAYLSERHEDFWLFHPDRPFWQTPAAESGTAYSAAKLNGELSESSNKLRLFPVRSGKAKESLSYQEAARWLLHINAYDDRGSKPTPKRAWVGSLGTIMAVGDNLFETLMLNLVMLQNVESIWEKPKPCWERLYTEKQRGGEIVVPDNQAELLTVQSRYILLKPEKNRVVSYNVAAGEYFEPDNAFEEQFTLWKSKREESEFEPQKFEAARQIWRDVPKLFSQEKGRQPGVVRWIAMLQRRKMISEKKTIVFHGVSAFYDVAMESAITDIYSDSLRLHTALLTELGEDWQVHISDEIDLCDQAASALGWLAVDLRKAEGWNPDMNSDKAGQRSYQQLGQVKEQFYHQVDKPFRKWLETLDPEDSMPSVLEKIIKWKNTARQIAQQMGEKLVRERGELAYKGRTIKEKEKGREIKRHYSSPEAFNWFVFHLSKIYPKTGKAGSQ